MTIDLTARNHQILIYNAEGSDPLDVSSVAMDASTSDRQLDQSGLVQTSGNLTLHGYAGLSESMDARINSTRWARGNKIELWIADESGTLVRHPRGALRLLKEPSPPTQKNPTISLELGCALSLLDYRQPPDDKSGVTLGNATSRTTIINNILSAAGAPALIDTVPGSLNVPLFRFEGSYIEQAGAIAFAVGYVLWVDNLERVRATKVDFKANTPFLTLILGQNEVEYEPLRDAETPCELIRATGVTYGAKANEDPDSEYSISRASLSSVFNTADDAQTVIETNLTRYLRTTTSNPNIEQERKQLLGLIMPDAYPNNRSLVDSDRTTNESFFEGGSSKRLKKKVQTTYGLKGAILPTYFPGNRDRIPVKRVVITPEYAGESTLQITTNTYEPFALVNPVLYQGSGSDPKPSPETLTISQSVVQRWKRYSQGWTSTTTTTNYKQGTSRGGSVASVSGTSTAPPAPERQQESVSREEKQLVGEAHFVPRAGAAFSEREREYQVAPGTVTTKEELELIARDIGALLIGRSQGIECVSDLKDDWLTDYEPIKRIDWQEGNTTFSYLANGISFAQNQRSCAVGADGIWIGTQVGENPIPTPPYSILEVLEIPAGNSLDVVDYPYDLQLPLISMTIANTDRLAVNLGDRSFNLSATDSLLFTDLGSGGGSGGSGAQYTGNGTTRSITVSLDGESADWVAIYNRTSGVMNFFDSVRGIGKYSDAFGSQENTESDSLTSFDVNGFSLGANSGSADVNKNAETYMAWALAEGSNFDVVTWTGNGTAGRAVAHNLGAIPTVIMVSRRNAGLAWTIYHSSLGSTTSFEFPGSGTISGEWDATNPTSTHFTVSDSERVNGLDFSEVGYEYVAYLWATPSGSYTGNGSDPGALEVVGSEPSQLWIISTNSSEGNRAEMTIFDNTRNASNPRDKAAVIADLTSGGETTGAASVDFASNGFTPNDDARVNASGRTYYYWYF